MSTQFYTTNQQTPYEQAPHQQGGGGPRSRIWVAHGNNQMGGNS